MKISGIYKIINKINGRYYVGSSNDMSFDDGRFYEHLRDLRKGTHHSPYLQRAWNKYGENNFGFVIVEECASDKKTLLATEQKYLDIAKTEKEKCYNMRFLAEGGEMREETRKKLSEASKKYYKNLSMERKIEIVNNLKKFWTYERRMKQSILQKLRWTTKLKQKMGETKKKWYSEHPEMKLRCTGTKNKIIHHFRNRVTQEIFIGPRCDFRHKYNLNQAPIVNLIQGRIKSYRDWVLSNEDK